MDRKRAFIINFAYFAILLLLAFVLLRYGLRLLMPFVVGGIVAALLQKPIRFLAKYLPLPKKILALLVALLFFCTIGVLISILSVRVFTLGQDIALSLPTLYREYVEPLIRDIFALLETSVLQMDEALLQTWEEMFYQLLQSLGNMISSVSVRMVGIASSFASSLPGVFIRLLFFVIATFFMTMDYDRLTGFLMRQMSERVQDLFLQIKSYIVGTLFVCIRSYALIMSITFVELSIGLSIVGVEHSVLKAFLIAIFDILPVLGTGGIMIPWAVLSMIQGEIGLGLALLAVYIAVTIIRNILEPKIVGSQLGLHPVVTLASMFVGAQLFGVVGLFGLPIFLSLLCYLNRNGTIHIFRLEDPQ